MSPSTTEPSAARLRRLPQQDRSRRRVERVLDCADQLLAADGPAALTTTAVARAAGISVGSLYQWFGDREAIAEALALRYLEGFKRVAEEVAATAEARPTGDPVGAAIDAFADAFRTNAGFRALWFGGLRSEHLRDVTRPGLEDIGASLARTLAAELPGAPRRALAPTARMCVLTADALLRQAFRADPAGDPALLDETKRMLRAYVADRLGGSTRRA